MTSVFDKFRSNNPLNMIQEIKRIQQDPSQIGQMLFNNGRITQSQYETIRTMNNPKDICVYLMGQNEQFRNAVQTMKTLQS